MRLSRNFFCHFTPQNRGFFTFFPYFFLNDVSYAPEQDFWKGAMSPGKTPRLGYFFKKVPKMQKLDFDIGGRGFPRTVF